MLNKFDKSLVNISPIELQDNIGIKESNYVSKLICNNLFTYFPNSFINIIPRITSINIIAHT